jgi:hypothetical protein
MEYEIVKNGTFNHGAVASGTWTRDLHCQLRSARDPTTHTRVLDGFNIRRRDTWYSTKANLVLQWMQASADGSERTGIERSE